MYLTEQQIGSFHDSYIAVPEGGCWIWEKDGCDPRGYGHMTINGKSVGAHRASWMIHVGPIPPNMLILHKCDNPFCVNPHHLRLGTTQDNIDDRNQKGRQAKGSRHGMAKLSEKDVLEIRAAYPSERGIDLAARFKVSKQLISVVVNRQVWAHI